MNSERHASMLSYHKAAKCNLKPILKLTNLHMIGLDKRWVKKGNCWEKKPKCQWKFPVQTAMYYLRNFKSDKYDRKCYPNRDKMTSEKKFPLFKQTKKVRLNENLPGI